MDINRFYFIHLQIYKLEISKSDMYNRFLFQDCVKTLIRLFDL